MKTCPVCQKFVTDQAKFCYYCGASLLNVAPDAPAPANADPDRIKQVFVNLLDNAIKYSPDYGTVEAQIKNST